MNSIRRFTPIILEKRGKILKDSMNKPIKHLDELDGENLVNTCLQVEGKLIKENLFELGYWYLNYLEFFFRPEKNMRIPFQYTISHFFEEDDMFPAYYHNPKQEKIGKSFDNAIKKGFSCSYWNLEDTSPKPKIEDKTKMLRRINNKLENKLVLGKIK